VVNGGNGSQVIEWLVGTRTMEPDSEVKFVLLIPDDSIC
jgi:hypothetical protein